MNTLVNFELAKLLKEKGFDVKVRGRIHVSHWHLVKDNIIPSNVNIYYTDMFAPLSNWNDGTQHFMSIPTIAEVVMWLYEKHGIWIEVRHIKTFNVNRFHVIIWNYKDTSDYITIHCENGVGYEVWDSLTEAYEASINYTLNNLI